MNRAALALTLVLRGGCQALLVVIVLALAACTSHPAGVTGAGAQWPAADPLFHQDRRWLGSDGAYSCDLGGGRVAWLFGDTFVATSDAHTRSEAVLPRNTVAVETRTDPTAATMEFAWKLGPDGKPASFFPGDGARWHWPAGCARVPGGPLVVFLMIEESTSGGLGFAAAGWRAAFIDDPDDPASTWQVTTVDAPPQTWDAGVGTAVARDGDFVYALAASTDSAHRGYLARFPVASLAARDLASITWWDGAAWVAPGEIHGAPAVVIDDAGPEASLHRDARLGLWIHVASVGFGATTIAIRTAPAVTGPWSDARDVYTPPESRGPAPFVYAAKAHPELTGPGGALVVTYAVNSFTFADLFTPTGMMTLGWPRFVAVSLAPE